MTDLYACACAEFYGRHHDECPAQRQHDALASQLAAAQAELRQCQSDRQREHDLRVKMAGGLEAAQARIAEAERLLRGALSEIVVTDATATMYGEIDTWLAGAREGA